MFMRRIAVTSALVLATAGCSLIGGGEEEAPAATEPTASGEVGGRVVLVTHESFTVPKELIAAFEQESGIDLVTRASGDGGTLSAKLALTQGNPTGDLAFGIDNTFASRPLDAGVFAEYEPTLPPGAEQYALDEGADRLTPIDVGHVCVNIDRVWFDKQGIVAPVTLDDLTDPTYQDLMVTPGASTSSVGMSFLLSTIAAYGADGWQDYWTRLLGNGAKVVDGWEDAYYGDFTQGGDQGTRPIVVSYDSSPAFTVPEGSAESTTSALLETCFRQVEYAGVLEGAKNPAAAAAVLDWLLSDDVQASLPTSMYVFPVSDSVEVPADWAKYAVQPTEALEVSPGDIAANREQWLAEWTDLVTR